MPLSHGLFQNEAGHILFRFRILGTVDALTRQFGDYLRNDCHKSNVSEPTNVELQGLRLHVTEIIYRLLFSLDQLERSMVLVNQHFNQGPRGRFVLTESGIFADSVIHYINTLVDSIGRIVLLAIGKPDLETKGRGSQFSKAMAAVKRLEDNVEHTVKLLEIFNSLSSLTSWWSIAFKTSHGFRQWVTHYPDTIMFQGEGVPSHASAFLRSHYKTESPREINFTEELIRFLQGLFVWLDKLDSVLLPYFCARTGANMYFVLSEYVRIDWYTYLGGAIDPCKEGRKIADGFSLYLPKCDDSPPLDSLIRWSDEYFEQRG